MYMYAGGKCPLFHISPQNSTTRQFVMRKINPTLMGRFKVTSIESTPAFCSNVENPKLRPMRTLKTGPAKHAVTAL
jgi:hypothetical protein